MPVKDSTVEISSLEDGSVVFRLLRSNTQHNHMLEYSRFNPEPPVLPCLDTLPNVTAYGQQIRSALAKHTAVRDELVQMFGLTSGNEAILSIAMSSSEGERYRWETLCDDQSSFLALRQTCSVNRIVMGNTTQQNSELRMFDGAIRMSAFISPRGITSRGEFDSITIAIAHAQALGCDVRAKIYVGEQDLLDDALDLIANGQLHNIQVLPIPADAIGIENAFKNDLPQIEHCFCHGSIKAGVQLLEFASISDHDTCAETGSVQISIDRLNEVLNSIKTVWMMVLNNCSGAQYMPQLFSMAYTLARQAAPVTIGMAEPIDHRDATLFASSFYSLAFEAIVDGTRNLEDGTVTTIDFRSALRSARAALYQAASTAAIEFGRWSLPVIYLREPPLKVTRSTDNRMKSRIDGVAQALRNFPSDTPMGLRQEVLDLLNKPPVVPQPLRPDLFGRFP
jgi:hypothetical protein